MSNMKTIKLIERPKSAMLESLTSDQLTRINDLALND
jgi:hypothetical protein